MQFILTQEEFNELNSIKENHEELISELTQLVDDKDALQEFVKNWLY